MFSRSTHLWGGLAGVFSGLFWIITWPATSGTVPIVLALVLGLGGLAGLYSRQSEQGGRFGWAGFVLSILGTALALAVEWWLFASGFRAPPILSLSLGMMILGIGIVLLGVTSLRGNALHHWRGLPLGLGLLNMLGGIAIWRVYYLPRSQGRDPWHQWSLIGGYVIYPAEHALNALSVLLGLGWLGLGIMLAREANAQVVPPPPASA